ncbi:MAG: hypothetical protein ACFCVE_07315 [Phycisphaerae bacterium]
MQPAPREPEDSPHVGSIAIERRRSTREPVVTLGNVQPLEPLEGGYANGHDAAGPAGQSRPMQVLITNVSLHGCGFRCAERLRIGLLYRIEVNLGPLYLTSRMRVARVRTGSDGTFHIGGEFI